MNEGFFKTNLITLAEIGQRLADSQGLRDSLSKTLATIHESDLFVRSFAALYEPQTEKLSLYATEGFNVNEYRRLENRLNKSFTGGEMNGENRILVEKASREIAFDFISPRGAETSFLGVPIVLGKRKAGFLGVEIVYDEKNDFESLFNFLAVIAAMISQALKSQTEIATEKEKLFEETSHLQQELREKYDFNNLIGNSGPMRQIYAQVSQVARSNATVLLRGESGTGKEMIANAIHYNSLRAKKPIIKINCAALPETLIEAELFGYEKGAFTGANQRKKGRFELADGGTLFLDEIGDLNASTQIKLLRALQEREFERLGGTETVKVNVRLVAATNKELEGAMAAGEFREDLYYRLNVFNIFMPPLRERKPDVILLADHFLEKYAREHRKHIKRISTPAIDMLTSYHWPGNVRELENVVERAVVVCDSSVIHGHHLPPSLQTAEGSGTVTRLSLSSAVEAYERDIIQDALKSARGSRKKAAKLLDTTERIIGYKVKKYGIDCDRFR